MLVMTPCSCCMSSLVIVYIVILYYLMYFIKLMIKNLTTIKILHRIINIIMNFFNLSLIVFLLGYVILLTNDNARNFTFYNLFSMIASTPNPTLDNLRCQHLSNIKGRVLEIGPGPGTNFKCWINNADITEWVGIEPNAYFKEKQLLLAKTYNLSFPIRTVWLKGENIDVEPNSYDVVVGTHVLCSVDNVRAVLYQIAYTLKPNGIYYFLEHTKSVNNDYLNIIQQIVEPLIMIFGNGCKFKSLWDDVSSDIGGGLIGFSVNTSNIEIPMPIPILAPHIIGTATKL